MCALSQWLRVPRTSVIVPRQNTTTKVNRVLTLLFLPQTLTIRAEHAAWRHPWNAPDERVGSALGPRLEVRDAITHHHHRLESVGLRTREQDGKVRGRMGGSQEAGRTRDRLLSTGAMKRPARHLEVPSPLLHVSSRQAIGRCDRAPTQPPDPTHIFDVLHCLTLAAGPRGELARIKAIVGSVVLQRQCMCSCAGHGC